MLPETPLFEIGMSDSVQIGDKLFLGALLHWSEGAFSQFAFDLLAMLQGTYRAGYASSFYGLGSSFDELMRMWVRNGSI